MRIHRDFRNVKFDIELNRCFGLALLWDYNKNFFAIGFLVGPLMIGFERHKV